MQNSKRTINLYQLIVSAVVLLVSLFVFCSDLSRLTDRQLSWLVVADIAMCALLFAVGKAARLNNARFLFWAITTVFSFGQNIAHIFMSDQSPLWGNLIYHQGYSQSMILEGLVFSILAYNFFSVGLAVCSKKTKTVTEQSTSLEGKNYTASILLVSRVLLAVSVLPQLYYMYKEIQLFLTKGYGYSASNQVPGFVQILHYWFMPALLMSYVGNAGRDKKPVLETAIILVTAGVYMLIGDRGYALSMLLTLLWLRQTYHYGSKRTTYILFAVLLLLIPFVKFFRTAFSGGAGGALSEAFTEMFEVNPFMDLLMELGSTQEIIFMTLKRVGNEGLAYGTAYLDFLILMLPGVLGIRFFYGNLAQWVLGTTAYQTRGFSIWGEAYLNFGKWGALGMFFIGKAFGALLGAEEKESPLRIILTATTLYFFADVARRAISNFGYNFLYNIILPIFAVQFIYDFFKIKRTSG